MLRPASPAAGAADSVHLAVKDDETEKSAIAFLQEAAAAFPFRLTHVLTDNGSCFTPAFASACAALGADYRHTRPRTPQTNGMVERFNGRVGSEVLGITIYSHRDLEQLLRDFNAAYNARRQRVLDGKTPNQVVAERLKARRELARGKLEGRAGPNDVVKACSIVEAAKEVSKPDMGTFSKTLSASLRVGFVAARPAMAGALADIKLLSVVATSDYVERFVFGLIAGGHYLRHLRRLRTRIEAATGQAIGDLDGVGLRVSRPRDGGFYLWAKLPAGTDEAALCRQAAAHSIFLAPGAVFSPDRGPHAPAIRINVAHASNPRFLSFMEQILRQP